MEQPTRHSSVLRPRQTRIMMYYFVDCLDVDDSLNHLDISHLAARASATTSKVMSSVEWAVQHVVLSYFLELEMTATFV